MGQWGELAYWPPSGVRCTNVGSLSSKRLPRAGDILAPFMTLAPGTQLGPYEIVSQLGHGGMGVVYEARDPRLKRTVAIKLLPPDLTRDDTAKQRFLQEAQAASALDHPNICTIFEINETDDGQLYLVMAHYEGETLKERIARGPLKLDDAVDIATQVGQGLAEAHGAGIVHRDIKPANLLVTKTGVVKILDFGLAKLASNSESSTQSLAALTLPGVVLGTVAYMSPEQANGEEADQQSDVWALGAVLYETLTGQRPFPGDRPAVVMHGITDQTPTPVPRHRPEASPDVVRVVNTALEKSCKLRYQSALDFVAALRGISTRAQRDAAPADATGPTEITPAANAIPSEVPSIAVLPFTNMSADPENEFFADGISEEIINTLGQIEGLRVAARGSAFSFKGTHIDPRVVGQKLQVSTVLEGSVRKAGTRLRITAELVNAADGFQLWSERYDRELEDIFEIQDEIARTIADRLKITLTGEAEVPLASRATDNVKRLSRQLLEGASRSATSSTRFIGYEQAVGRASSRHWCPAAPTTPKPGRESSDSSHVMLVHATGWAAPQRG